MNRLNCIDFVRAFRKRMAARGRKHDLLLSEAGTVTVEFVLWIPLVFLIILFAIDVSLIYLKQADMWNVARDAARRLSVSSTYTNAQAQADAKAQLFNSLQGATVTANGAISPATDKVVTISIPLCQASLFGVVGCYDNSLTLTARVTMASEY